ncbi:hypothetical protein [Stenotrophomonas pigmentata]|uniref:hypothetical protein n=1 Tax=Stenotrophomonas pigmentata TaxID=3055080 RepID=UPI0026ED51BE|nr:hypothetical protein [Stenotrophomonas sp. 610A2]
MKTSKESNKDSTSNGDGYNASDGGAPMNALRKLAAKIRAFKGKSRIVDAVGHTPNPGSSMRAQWQAWFANGFFLQRTSSGSNKWTAEEISRHFQAFGFTGSGKMLIPWGDFEERTQCEKEAIQARWDARCLSRSTTKASAPAKAVRL